MEVSRLVLMGIEGIRIERRLVARVQKPMKNCLVQKCDNRAELFLTIKPLENRFLLGFILGVRAFLGD